MHQLAAAIDAFVTRINRAAMSSSASAHLVGVLWAKRGHETAADGAWACQPLPAPQSLGSALALRQVAFLEQAQLLLTHCAAADEQSSVDAMGPQPAPSPGTAGLPLLLQKVQETLQDLERAYAVLKTETLAAGADGRLPLGRMDDALARYSALRRALQQAVAARLPHQPGVPA